MKKIINILFLILFLNQLSFAEITDFGGDFSTRSQILNSFKQTNITQEQKDILKAKKLNLSTKCLIDEIKKGNIENVQILLDAKLNPNEDYFGATPIYMACAKNREDIALLLLKNGARLNKSFDSELFQAIKNKNHNLSMILIENGADVNYSSMVQEKSVLYLALKNKMYDTAKLLISSGAKPDRKSVLYMKKKKLGYLLEK